MEQAQRIFNRMSENEKIKVRCSTPAGLEFLADTDFRSDMPLLPFEERAAVMVELRALCVLDSVQRAESARVNSVRRRH
jgi:hypothetical protein